MFLTMNKLEKLSFLLVNIMLLCSEVNCDGYRLFNNTAQAALQRADFVKSEIIGNISNFHKYKYDNVANRKITDGGDDMYDSGNMIYVWSSDEIRPANGMTYEKTYSSGSFEFMSTKGWPFLAMMYINSTSRNPTSYYMQVRGDAGADGSGKLVYYDGLYVSACGKSVKYYSSHIYDANDPSICEILFAFGNDDELDRSFRLETRGKSTTHKTNAIVVWNNQSKNGWLGYILLSRSDGGQISEKEVTIALSRLIAPIIDCDGRYCDKNNFTCVKGRCRIVNDGQFYECQCDDGYYGFECRDTVKVSVAKQLIAIGGDDVFRINVNVIATGSSMKLYLHRSNSKSAVQIITVVGRKTFSFSLNTISKTMEGNYNISMNTSRGYYSLANCHISIQEKARIEKVYPRSTYSPGMMINQIVCRAVGIPPPRINWYRNNLQVRRSSRHQGVFQSGGKGTAYLNVTNAKMSDNGTYVCQATNTVGPSNSNHIITVFDSAELTVYGPPTIASVHSVRSSNCTKKVSLAVLWNPGEHAARILHRITVKSTNSSIHHTFSINTRNTETLLRNLLPLTHYQIQITVCPDGCIQKLNATVEFVTSEIQPHQVKQATSRVKACSNVCLITWEFNNTGAGDRILYTEISWKVGENTSFSFQLQGKAKVSWPSTTYALPLHESIHGETKVYVQATSCTGVSNTMLANGGCKSTSPCLGKLALSLASVAAASAIIAIILAIALVVACKKRQPKGKDKATSEQGPTTPHTYENERYHLDGNHLFRTAPANNPGDDQDSFEENAYEGPGNFLEPAYAVHGKNDASDGIYDTIGL